MPESRRTEDGSEAQADAEQGTQQKTAAEPAYEIEVVTTEEAISSYSGTDGTVIAPEPPIEHVPTPAPGQSRAARLAAAEDAVDRKAATTVIRIRPMATPARFRLRHKGLILAFLLIVAAPTAGAFWYLESRAAAQYASTLAFTVRSEDAASASILSGLSATLGGSALSDSAILYEYIGSQELVAKIDAQLDLRSLYSRSAETDPVFSFMLGGTIEDLTSYWGRMVRIAFDESSGLMELRVLAFDPDEAQMIAEAIMTESSLMINELSANAREDKIRYAREDLDVAVTRLRDARGALTAFRIENEIVDVNANIQGQMGLLNNLQAQLANALIELDLLRGSSSDSDPRLQQLENRIRVIEDRIEDERRRVGQGGARQGDDGYAMTLAEFEGLNVNTQFAQQAYLAALAAFDTASATANRQSLYLAAYIQPTVAEKSEYPQKPLVIGLVALFSFLIWTIMSLVYYALRDRR